MQILKRKKTMVYREEVILSDGRRITKTFTRKTDALIWKRTTELENDRKEALGLTIRDTMTFRDFAEEWLLKTAQTKAPSTLRSYVGVLKKHLYPVLANLELREIRAHHADRIVKNLRDTHHNPKGINSILVILKAVLNEAVRRDCLVKSPLHHYPRLKVTKRVVYWSEMEVRQFLMANIDDPAFPVYVVALNTGMRRGELAGLKWDRVNFERNLIEISRIRDRYGLRETTKSGRIRLVPMNRDVRTILEKRRIDQGPHFSDFVFDIEAHHMYREFAKAQTRAKMEKRIRFHDLRHTFASHFMMKHGNIYDLQKILGHTSLEMTQIYAHLSPDHLAQTTSILNFLPHISHTLENSNDFIDGKMSTNS